MLTRRRPLPVLIAFAALVAAIALSFVLAPRHHRARPAPSAPAPVAPATARSGWLRDAEAGFARSRAWWDPQRGWYRQFLPGSGPSRLASMWGIVHLFGTANAIAIADPSPANVRAAHRFAAGAERYWNPALRPVPAYGSQPGRVRPAVRTWYDDEAWWGVAYFDAFRATGDRRWLVSAQRSLAFLDSGWNPHGGGIFWDTRRTFVSSESLAGATLTAAALYGQTHRPAYLALARKYVGWANAHIRGRDGLYGARSSPARPMPYVEGPMAEAELRLCRASGRQRWCAAGEALMRATAARFPTLTMGPQYDAIYIRSLLEVYRLDRNPRWYRIAAAVGRAALAHAAAPNGLYLRTWSGSPIATIGTRYGKLQTHAATTSVLAWLAAAKPPAR